MNEPLRQALLRARLSEDDVAARLQVDPKTVRRWLEGRLPYLRHRWALSGLLGADEAALWPEVRAAIAARSRPAEIQAVYPHLSAVPRKTWLCLFGSAAREIAILNSSGLFLAEDPDILAVLADRIRAGARARICLRDPDCPAAAEPRTARDAAAAAWIRKVLAMYGRLRDSGEAQIRLHRAVLYSSVYRADDQLLVSQHAYGIADQHGPVLHLRQTADDDMATTYLDAFEHTWAAAMPLE